MLSNEPDGFRSYRSELLSGDRLGIEGYLNLIRLTVFNGEGIDQTFFLDHQALSGLHKDQDEPHHANV